MVFTVHLQRPEFGSQHHITNQACYKYVIYLELQHQKWEEIGSLGLSGCQPSKNPLATDSEINCLKEVKGQPIASSGLHVCAHKQKLGLHLNGEISASPCIPLLKCVPLHIHKEKPTPSQYSVILETSGYQSSHGRNPVTTSEQRERKHNIHFYIKNNCIDTSQHQ